MSDTLKKLQQIREELERNHNEAGAWACTAAIDTLIGMDAREDAEYALSLITGEKEPYTRFIDPLSQAMKEHEVEYSYACIERSGHGSEWFESAHNREHYTLRQMLKAAKDAATHKTLRTRVVVYFEPEETA